MDDSRETCRHAVTAMVWAVLGFYFVPLLGTALAFIYAGRADRAIRRDPGLAGAEMAASARSLAKAQVVLILLFVAVLAGIMLAYADAVRDYLDMTTAAPTPTRCGGSPSCG